MTMLETTDAMPTVAVKDLKVARKFYEGTLGLQPVREDMGTVGYKSGNSTVLVYPSSYAGTNKATAVTWAVGDKLENIVSALKAKGVVFEHYDMPGITRKGDIHIAGKIRNAWFKDPDGNILSLVSG
jgi:catechol 2,3-dioxygenase-like lactoylglutathione lyase family enzyme